LEPYFSALKPGHCWKIIEDEKHMIHNFGIHRFNKTNYKKIKEQKENKLLLDIVKDPKRKQQNLKPLLFADFLCIDQDPTYDAVHNPDYFFEFNIQTLQEEMLVKALLMIPMVDKKLLINLDFGKDLHGVVDTRLKEPSMLRQMSKN